MDPRCRGGLPSSGDSAIATPNVPPLENAAKASFLLRQRSGPLDRFPRLSDRGITLVGIRSWSIAILQHERDVNFRRSRPGSVAARTAAWLAPGQPSAVCAAGACRCPRVCAFVRSLRYDLRSRDVRAQHARDSGVRRRRFAVAGDDSNRGARSLKSPNEILNALSSNSWISAFAARFSRNWTGEKPPVRLPRARPLSRYIPETTFQPHAAWRTTLGAEECACGLAGRRFDRENCPPDRDGRCGNVFCAQHHREVRLPVVLPARGPRRRSVRAFAAAAALGSLDDVVLRAGPFDRARPGFETPFRSSRTRALPFRSVGCCDANAGRCSPTVSSSLSKKTIRVRWSPF
jgi:hypothetical protein